MSSSKKRSRPGPPPSTPKRPRNEDPFVWTPSGAQILLSPSHRLAFTGRGLLTVHNGEIDVFGRIVDVNAGPITVSTDSTMPLFISVVSMSTQVPLSGPGGAVFSIDYYHSTESTFDITLQEDINTAAVSDIPEVWKGAAQSIAQSIVAGRAAGAPPPCIFVGGPKKVGKSTFNRYLTNVLLNISPKVAYLDTDCGQPEFTPPGVVSLSTISSPLTGPPHCHQSPSFPAAAHFIGDTSPSIDPGRYIACISNLYTNHWLNSTSTRHEEVPLVVNTHGWVKGFGFDLVCDMLRMLRPTHFVHVMSPHAGKNLPQGIFWISKNPSCADGTPLSPPLPPPPLLFDLPAIQQQRQQLVLPLQEDGTRVPSSAVEVRALAWTAFAAHCIATMSRHSTTPTAIGMAVEEEKSSVGNQLASLVPYKVLPRDLHSITVLHTSVPPSELGRVLNGAIVGLCGNGNGNGNSNSNSSTSVRYCRGIGIVRAVDGGALYILTPMTLAQLERVRAIEVGKLEFPSTLLLTDAYQSPYLALHSLSASGTGAGSIRSRNNLLRTRQVVK